MKKIKENFKRFSAIYLTVILILSMIGIAFAIIQFTRSSGENTINLGQISMSYEEPSNAYVLENALPISDDKGKILSKYFEFEVTTHATTDENDSVGVRIPYEVNLGELAIDSDKTKLSKNQIKVYVTRMENGSEVKVAGPILLSKLSTSTLNQGAIVAYSATDVHKNSGDEITTTYRLRAWIDNDVDASIFKDMTYQYKFSVNINSNVKPLNVGMSLNDLIMERGVVSEGDGLYESNETNDGRPTYYYHGAVENNYVSFAGQTWRVIRINEDGTVRMIMQDGINSSASYSFNSVYTPYSYMYYSKSNMEGGAMKNLEDWYTDNLGVHDSKIANSIYCEQAKVKEKSSWTSGAASMEVYNTYEPNFMCEKDGNEEESVYSKIGLITIDEVLHAGGIFFNENSYYLVNKKWFWTMGPAGFANSSSRVWRVSYDGTVSVSSVDNSYSLRPVISLNLNTLVTGSGLADDMWIVQ